MDHTIIIVNGFDDLSCNERKMVMEYEVSPWLHGHDGVWWSVASWSYAWAAENFLLNKFPFLAASATEVDMQ